MKRLTPLIIFLIICPFLSVNVFSQKTTYERFVLKSKEALDYCKQKKLNTSICVFVDMSIHSGKNRLFVWDFEKDSIVLKGLCSHGCGDNEWGATQTKTKPIFSNVPESHCSSLGKYKIGKRGYSNWGINVNYKMHGLEKTNSNAYSRIIVLHSWDYVTNHEPYPEGTPEGWGCPAVANSIMKQLDLMLKKVDTPVLFWIYQ